MNESELPMTTIGPKEQKVIEENRYKYRQEMKRQALNSLKYMFNNLEPQDDYAWDYELACKILEELAQ